MQAPAPLPAPTASFYLQQMPPELRRALVDYVQAEYLFAVGESEAGAQARARALATIEDHKTEKRSPSFTTRSNVL